MKVWITREAAMPDEWSYAMWIREPVFTSSDQGGYWVCGLDIPLRFNGMDLLDYELTPGQKICVNLSCVKEESNEQD